MSIKYRVATVSDNKKLDALDLASTDGELATYSRNKKDLFDVKDYHKRGGSFWVAEDGNKIIGMVGVRLSDEGMKVKALRVHPEYRKLGIGRKLMNILEEYCKKHKVIELILGVNKESLPAIKLYESLGYKRYKEKEFKPGNIVYYYKKTLN